MNTDATTPSLLQARERVLEIQTKLHRWACGDQSRRFDDLFNLVVDPDTLLVAWSRVRGNKGARSAGVDGQTAFLSNLRSALKEQRYRPRPVRERMIPKAPGKWRRLGIPTVTA